MILTQLVKCMIANDCQLEELKLHKIVAGQGHRFTEFDFIDEWAAQTGGDARAMKAAHAERHGLLFTEPAEEQIDE